VAEPVGKAVMNAIRFLDSSDLHQGRAFGDYPKGLRYNLSKAQHGAIGRRSRRLGSHPYL
jgi:hypothetical protein